MFRAHGGTVLGAKVAYGASCVASAVILAVSGVAYYVQAKINGVASSDVDTGGPQTGAMNILLMGLESRTDYDGNVLPSDLLTAMHAGSVQGVLYDGVGGQDTNTLILIHIFAGGKKAVGFSIPRDDLVTYPQAYDGETQGKIDQAYGDAYEQSLQETVNSSMSRDQRYKLANEAGQAATIATVESVTGVHVDHFAEVNLAGFFELAQAFGGVEVCVKPTDGDENLYDTDSGWNAVADGYSLRKGGSQYLHLQADQALAFVRDRDSLPELDLDRTKRQQAVIDYVIWKLEHEGVLTSLGQITSLLDVANRYVITSGGWDLALFANELHALTGSHLTFYTLPIATYENNLQLSGYSQPQDVNIINVPYIQQVVHDAFYPPPAPKKAPAKKAPAKAPAKTAPVPPPSTVTVDVYNGGSTPGLAGAVSQAFVSAGYTAGVIGNSVDQAEPVQPATQVFYGAGTAANAAKIARYFGVTAVAGTSLAAGHVEVLLGTTSTVVPSGLGSPGGSPASSASASPTATSAANNGAAGGAVTVGTNAPYGIPCVY